MCKSISKIVILSALGLGLPVMAGGGSIWQLEQTPSSEVFNGISASSVDFAIGVGNNGAIVHFANGDSGTVVASGTTNDLFDVRVASPSLAVAGGDGVVLLWNGVSWTEIRSSTAGAINSGIWIAPQEDVVFFNDIYPGSQFPYFVCPYQIGDTQPRFCRNFDAPMLNACGDSLFGGDIKTVMANGDIYHLDNSVNGINGFAPIFDYPTDLELTAVWIPPVVCLPGEVPPRDLFAIRHGNEFWRFDGSAWANMNVSVPAGQTLTWLDGNGTNSIVAVGFKPAAGGGNEGVVWLFDGSSWTEDTNLPPGTPGLTDVAMSIRPGDGIFSSGFEIVPSNMTAAGMPIVDILATAEEGRRIRSRVLFPDHSADLGVEKRLLTTPPIHLGDRVVFVILLQNRGPSTALNVTLTDAFNFHNLGLVSNDCGLTTESSGLDYTRMTVELAELLPDATFACTLEFDVTDSLGSIYNIALASELEGSDPDNLDNASFVLQDISP
jgi:hypothetical protein